MVSVELFSVNKAATSSFNKLFNSPVPTYLLAATRASIRLMILRVVLTPTSPEIRTSSKLSNTSASTVDFPATALASLPKKLSFVFDKPSFKLSFSSLPNSLLKNPIMCFVVGYKCIKNIGVILK